MRVDIDALNAAIGEDDREAIHSAALRIALNELDLRLLYVPIIDVDLNRLKLWTRQLPVDIADGGTGLVLANAVALDRVWERTKHGVEPTAPVEAALQELDQAADAEALPAVDRAAARLSQAISALHAR